MSDPTLDVAAPTLPGSLSLDTTTPTGSPTLDVASPTDPSPTIEARTCSASLSPDTEEACGLASLISEDELYRFVAEDGGALYLPHDFGVSYG